MPQVQMALPVALQFFNAFYLNITNINDYLKKVVDVFGYIKFSTVGIAGACTGRVTDSCFLVVTKTSESLDASGIFPEIVRHFFTLC